MSIVVLYAFYTFKKDQFFCGVKTNLVSEVLTNSYNWVNGLNGFVIVQFIL